MTEYEENATREFLQWIERFERLWRSMVIRYAWTEVQGQPLLLHLHGSLETVAPADWRRPMVNPSVADYHAGIVVGSTDLLGELIEGFRRGSVELDGYSLSLKHQNQQPNRLFHLTDAGFQALNEPNHIEPQEFACAFLRGTGSRVHELTDGRLETSLLESRWKTLARPLADMQDVMDEFFEVKAGAETVYRQFAHITASVPIRFKDVGCGFTREDLGFEIEAPATADPAAISLGTILDKGGRKQRDEHTFEDAKRQDKDGRTPLTKVLPGSDIEGCRAYLKYEGVLLQSWNAENPWLPTENEAIIAHSYFDDDLQCLHRALAGKGKRKDKAPDFEIAVGWLLYFCGLPPLVYGTADKILGEVDLVTVLPDYRLVLCVECSTGRPDNKEKLSKLYKRLDALRRSLHNHRVVGAVATCLPAGQIPPSEQNKAADHGIALLAQETLDDLLRMAQSGTDPLDAIEYIAECVPSTTPFDAHISESQNMFRASWPHRLPVGTRRVRRKRRAWR